MDLETLRLLLATLREFGVTRYSGPVGTSQLVLEMGQQPSVPVVARPTPVDPAVEAMRRLDDALKPYQVQG